MTSSDSSEDSAPVVYADQRGFLKNGERYFPRIAEDWQQSEHCDAVRIVVPAGTEDDLTWKEEKKLAERSIEAGQLILWEIDWGQKSASLYDTAFFATQTLILQEWVASLGKLFQEQTLGVVLHRGPACPVLRDDNIERYYHWLEDKTNTPFQIRLYSTAILFEYLHRLGSFLPAAVPLLALLDVKDITTPALTMAEQAVIFSAERAGHIQLAIRGSKVLLPGLCWQEGKSVGGWIGRGVPPETFSQEIKVGLCLPSEEQWTSTNLEKLDDLLMTFQDVNLKYRFVPEVLLGEQWDGLDDLLVLESTLTAKGKRMLQGFIAAGGNVVTCDEIEHLRNWLSRRL